MKMKIWIFLLILSAFTISAQAEWSDDTLLDDFANLEHGGYGGLVVKFSKIKEESATFVGGRGGWLINHKFMIGGGGYGLVNDLELETQKDGNTITRDLMMGYGGLELEYIFTPNRLVHFSIQALIGNGVFQMVEDRTDWEDVDDEDDLFFILEPGANVILNVTSFFRIGAGVSYRFINGVRENDFVASTDLCEGSGYVFLKFGKF